MKVFLIILFAFFLISCPSGKNYNKLYVKDIEGNVYQIRHSLADTYFIDDVSESYNELKAIMKED